MPQNQKYCFKAHVEEMRQGIPEYCYKFYVEAYEKRYGALPDNIKDSRLYSYLECFEPFPCAFPTRIKNNFDTDLLFRLIVSTYEGKYSFSFYSPNDEKPEWILTLRYHEMLFYIREKEINYFSEILRTSDVLEIMKYCVFDLIRNELGFALDENAVTQLKEEKIACFKKVVSEIKPQIISNMAKADIHKIIKKK